jgi:FMN phosphatase YigB (HAD superfamily)
VHVEKILFDWGGTLVSVATQPVALYRGACAVAEILLGHRQESAVHDLAGQAARAEAACAADPHHREIELPRLLAAWATGHGAKHDDAQLAKAVEAVGEYWLQAGLEPFPGVLETAEILQKEGFRLGLVSNVFIPPDYCRRELARQGLADFMDFAIFSSEVGYRKPSPSIYEAALNAAYPDGRPRDLSKVLFVGDAPVYDVIVPASMGMRTALVASPAGTWPESDLEVARPDFSLASVTELPAKLKESASN